MAWQTIELEVSERIATVTLSRPRVHNAYNVRMRDELHEAFAFCREEQELRVVVLQGAGRSFCAGADLSEFGSAPTPLKARRIRFRRDVWDGLRRIPVPVIARLHGHVIGSGLEMALCANVRIAGAGTRFRMPEAAYGLVPAATGTQTIPRLCGAAAAAELLLLGAPFDAERALAAQLVDRVVADELLSDAVAAVAGELAAVPRGLLVSLVSMLRRAQSAAPTGERGRDRALWAHADGVR